MMDYYDQIWGKSKRDRFANHTVYIIMMNRSKLKSLLSQDR